MWQGQLGPKTFPVILRPTLIYSHWPLTAPRSPTWSGRWVSCRPCPVPSEFGSVQWGLRREGKLHVSVPFATVSPLIIPDERWPTFLRPVWFRVADVSLTPKVFFSLWAPVLRSPFLGLCLPVYNTLRWVHSRDLIRLSIFILRRVTTGPRPLSLLPLTHKVPLCQRHPFYFSRDLYLPSLPARCNVYMNYNDLTYKFLTSYYME